MCGLSPFARALRLVSALCLAGAVHVGAVGGPAMAAALPPPLTCTVVHGQCVVECGKAALQMFCKRYCAGKKSECLQTGSWNGEHGDTFEGVDRR